MPFPVPNSTPQPAADPPAMVRTVTREDVQWSRPIFKAPPLEQFLQPFDATLFTQDLRRVGLGER